MTGELIGRLSAGKSIQISCDGKTSNLSAKLRKPGNPMFTRHKLSGGKRQLFISLLMTVLSQPFLSFMSSNFMTFSLSTTRHTE
jgi:hypothetical protein